MKIGMSLIGDQSALLALIRLVQCLLDPGHT